MMEYIICNTCKTSKPISEFAQRYIGKFRSQCKVCYNAKRRPTRKKHRLENLDKILEKARAYFLENKERIYKKNKERNSSKREEIARKQREYRAQYPDRAQAANKKSRERHHEARLLNNRIRKNRQRAAEGSFTKQEWTELCMKYNNECVCCGEQKPLTVDHVIPLSKGGTNYISNIQPLCGSCNSKKHAKIVDYR